MSGPIHITPLLLDALAEIKASEGKVGTLKEIARRCQVGGRAMESRVRRLRKLGLVVGRGMLRVVIPNGGITIHDHDKDCACPGVEVASTLRDAAVMSEEGCCMVSDDKRKALVASSKEKLEAYKKKRGRPKKKISEDVFSLSRIYVAERRAVVPDFSVGQGSMPRFAKAVNALEKRHIGRSHYFDYVRHAFEVWRRMKKTQSACPPVSFLTSPTIIESYESTLGARKVNIERVSEILESEGIDSPATLVAAIGKRLMTHGKIEVPETITDETAKGVEVFLKRFDEIGYID